MKNNKISCPQCSYEFDVEEVLAAQVEEKLRAENKTKMEAIAKKHQEISEQLKKRELEIEQSKNEIDKLIKEKTETALKEERKQIAKETERRFKEELEMLQERDKESRKEISQLKSTKLENEKLKNQLADLRIEMEAEFEKEKRKSIDEALLKIQKQEAEKSEQKIKEFQLKELEYKEQIKQQNVLIDEMKRKAEQGSMQPQGEAMELGIEEMLASLFPLDQIAEVPKGVRGADVVQRVRNRLGNEVGVILFESKRTKSFYQDWVSKLKSDALLVNADICIIVSESLPEGMERFGQIEGVWICTYQDLKLLVTLLRDSLIRISEAFSSQSNKGEKMQMLYDYLMSNEFKLQIEAIVDGFNELQNGYIQERNAMERIWKRREKQLTKVLLNTNHFIGSIQGIAGSPLEGLSRIGYADDDLDEPLSLEGPEA